MNNRKEEVRNLLRLSPEEVIERAGKHLVVCNDLDALHLHFAHEIAEEIQKNNSHDLPTRLILPVGPTGQYPRPLAYLCCRQPGPDRHADADHALSISSPRPDLDEYHLCPAAFPDNCISDLPSASPNDPL